MSKYTTLVTGANGFVGSALVRALLQSPDNSVRGAYRHACKPGRDQVSVGDIGPNTDWSKALEEVQAVVHCAARVHIMRDAGSADSLAKFREVNVEGTANLARQAAKAGVKRLVYVSSIKVNGESTSGLPPYSYNSPASPKDAYGLSKWEAERQLWQISKETGLEVVVVRPPLVYGPGVKANFQRLMRLVQSSMPLPFGMVNNQRSMVYIENLVDLLTKCITHPNAAGCTFLVSDGKDLSTRQLIELLAKTGGLRSLQISVPPSVMYKIARLVKRQDFAERLLGSLQVDIAHTCNTLDWKPPFPPDEGVKSTMTAYIATGSGI